MNVNLIIQFRDWTMWIFELALVVLVAKSVLLERDTLRWIIKEFEYDESKDLEKKQRKTRTMKKTTTDKVGTVIVEESTETSEPVGQSEKK
jgi:hypothetical protein